MATETTNLHLVKPSYDDLADVAVINDNMDIIDGAFGELDGAIISEWVSKAATIPAGSQTTAVSIPAGKTGYTPIGIVGCYPLTGIASLAIKQFRISSSNAVITYGNSSENVIETTINACVLYSKA